MDVVRAILRKPHLVGRDVYKLKIEDGVLYSMESARYKVPVEHFNLWRTSFDVEFVGADASAIYYALEIKPGTAGVTQGLTETEYAKREGVSRQAIHKRIKKGTLKAERIGPLWIIPT